MKFKKVLLGLAILATVLVLAAYFGVNYAEKHYANRVIPVKDKVAVKIGGIDLSLFKGGVVLSDVELVDTMSSVATGRVDYVTVQGIQLWKLITGGGIAISSVSAEGINCALNLSRLKKDTISVASLDSLNATGTVDSGRAMVSSHLNDNVEDTDTIESMLYFASSEVSVRFDADMHPDLRTLDIDFVKFRPGKGKYDVDLGHIKTSGGIELIEIDSFQLIPRYPKYEFGFKAGRRMASINVLVNKIEVHHFDVKALMRDSMLSIRSIVCLRPIVDMFSDKRVPIDMERYGPLPQEALLNASSLISIDSLIIKDADVKYATMNPSTMEEGFLEFKRSYVSVYNITNVPERIKENSSMTLDMFSKFTNEGDLNAHFDFRLDRKDYRFTWNGSLGQMKLRRIDSFVLPIASMNIVQGHCHGLKFNVVSDADTSRGTMDFQYSNLKIMAMDSERKKERKFLSGVANALIVHSENLVGNKHYHQGKITFGREKNRGLPDYVWRSLENGILHTILPKGIAKSIEEQPAKAKEKESHKEERARKRAEKKARKKDKKDLDL